MNGGSDGATPRFEDQWVNIASPGYLTPQTSGETQMNVPPIPATVKDFDAWLIEHSAELTPAMLDAAKAARNALWQREANAEVWEHAPQSIKDALGDCIAAFWRLWLERSR